MIGLRQESKMRRRLGLAVCALLSCAAAQAQDNTLNVCHVSTSYDVSVQRNSVLFDRAQPQPQPRQVRMHDGSLQVDGTPVTLGSEDSDRVALFEQGVRALEPKVKAIADHGVDLAAQAVREQARQSTPQLAASGELDAHLDARVNELKARIARSHSTHDWQGDAFNRYVNGVIQDIAPLLAADLAQQGLTMAISGDLDGASRLRDTAANLPDTLQARITTSLQALRPQIQSLCPALQHLDTLEKGIGARMPHGGRLDLIQIGQ